MKKFLIIILIIILLAAIGAGVYYYLLPAGPDGERPLDPFGGILDGGDSGQGGSRATETPSGSGTDGMSATSTDPFTGAGSTAGEVPRLRRLSDIPAAGAAVYEPANGTTTRGYTVRFMGIARGNVYEAYTNSLEQRRITNTTVPKVRQAIWHPQGRFAVIGRINESSGREERFVATVINATSTGGLKELSVSSFGQSLKTAEFSPAGELFMGKVVEGRYIGTVTGRDGSERQIVDQPFTDWRADWPAENIITLTSAPSAFANGFSYFIDAGGGAPKKVIGDRAGLTVLASRDGDRLLFSESTDGAFAFGIYDLNEGAESAVPITTLPEKCVWSETNTAMVYCGVPRDIPNGDYPDAWYRGKVGFTDDIWVLNTETGAADRVMNLRQRSGEAIDVVEPELSPDENFLVFKNKRDDILWSLRLADI